jgi:hypothetical protein
MRLLLVVLAVLALSGPAFAQTTADPIQGKYEEVYVIAGRALDSGGHPVAGGILTIQLDQEGVKADPLRAAANCKGDFITSFNLRHVDPKGKAIITVYEPEGKVAGSTTVSLDPFYRRSDAIVPYAGAWNNECTQETVVWDVSASMSARLLNRTNETFVVGEEKFYARPYSGIIKLRYETPDGNSVCPPHPQDQTPGACETFSVDERGDMRYTFTLDQPFTAGGTVELRLFHTQAAFASDEPDVVERIPIDRFSRIGVKMIEVSGQGPPAGIYDTPALGPLVLLATLALLARVRR